MEADRYDILEKIGQGSFGIIRKVRRRSDGHVLCRKEISYARMSQKEKEQLQAELQILKGLRHPNIVAYYEREHMKASGDLHIYMEYCEQGDLGMRIKELKRTGQMATEDFVWSVFSQLVTALYRCHYGEDPPEVSSAVYGLASDAKPHRIATSGRGNAMILHRDLKPENIFLGADSSVKLGDFGLSKIMASHDFASTYVGTPFYMSPEICAAEQYSLHSDIWAFGCIMYELCSKSPPFNAKTHLDLIHKIRLGKVDPLSSAYSQELKDAINKCLRVNPTTRPDTVQLLNLPMVKLKRKEQEVIRQGRIMKAKEELLAKREHQLEVDRESMRQEIDNGLRREWEVKARLEIDRQVQLATQLLYDQFEAEVHKRLAQDLERASTQAQLPARSSTPEGERMPTHYHIADHRRSESTTDDSEDFPSTTDISDLSLESPITDRAPVPAKRSSRTPFARAHTMFEGSPMDIQMGEPSPAPIASLGLSPRQDAKQRYKPSSLSRNLFATRQSGRTTPDASLNDPDMLEVEEEDGDDILPLPSPTRNKGISGDPFKTLSSQRPALPRQKTAPAMKSAIDKPFTKSRKENVDPHQGLDAKSVKTHAVLKSPSRRMSKLPSASNLLVSDASSPTRKAHHVATSPTKGALPSGTVPRPVSRKREEAFGAQPAILQGRTLVELAQARTAVQDFASAGESRMASSRTVAPVWDPETEEMPSPFIVRGSKTSNLLAPALGGPGFRHLR